MQIQLGFQLLQGFCRQNEKTVNLHEIEHKQLLGTTSPTFPDLLPLLRVMVKL